MIEVALSAPETGTLIIFRTCVFRRCTCVFHTYFPPLEIHTYVCSSCIFHIQKSRSFILPISILSFSSRLLVLVLCTFSSPPPQHMTVRSSAAAVTASTWQWTYFVLC